MTKITLLKRFFKFSTFLLSLLVLLISLTVSPVYARMDKPDKVEKAEDKVIRHMEKMKEKCPSIDEKKKQVEKKLKDGTISWHKSCLYCHEEGQGAP